MKPPLQRIEEFLEMAFLRRDAQERVSKLEAALREAVKALEYIHNKALKPGFEAEAIICLKNIADILDGGEI